MNKVITIKKNKTMKDLNKNKQNRKSWSDDMKQAFINKIRIDKPEMTEQRYAETFVKKSNFIAREGKQVSISEKHHDYINFIVCSLYGRKITMANFLDNVLNEHFKMYGKVLRTKTEEWRKKDVNF